jgi:DNA-binding transcriptional ArsR family regulator
MTSSRCCPADCALREDWEEDLNKEITALSHEKTNAMNEIFRLMSHPIRLKILLMLCIRDHCVCEVIWNLKENHSQISNHLKILKDAGIIDSYYRSNHKIYRLSETRDHKFLKLIAMEWGKETGIGRIR